MLFWKYSRRLLVLNTHQVSKNIGTRSLSTVEDGKYKGNYDIIIAGGGMVGCTLACAISKNSLLSNLKVLLLESSPDKKFELKPEYSNRVVALNQNTKALMNSLDIWRHVEQMRLQPVRYMQVWDACSDAMISFSSAENLDDDVAYIVENDVLLHAVNTELNSSDNKNLSIVYGSRIAEYNLPSSGDMKPNSTVKLNNGDTYSCQLLIGADGANSAVRRAMGVQYLSWSYEQMGVVATLYLAEECENTTAWQRWLPTGPVAILPLDSQRSSLVWSNWEDNAKKLLKLPEEQFVDELNDALWKQYPRSSGVEACTAWMTSCLQLAGLPDGAARQLPPSIRAIAPSSRAAFPLGFGHSTRYIAPGVALIGDAAHRVHPLAGQGVNLGFGDVKDLTELLADTVYSGLDISVYNTLDNEDELVLLLVPVNGAAFVRYLIGLPGKNIKAKVFRPFETNAHSSWLEKYESLRQRHNVPTQLAIEALHRLYTLDLPPLVLLRSLGVQITNAIHPIKKMIMSQAAV